MIAKELIIVENISFSRGSTWVIQNLSFTLKQGECLALIGSNGTGKTTTLHLLAGLLRPTLGKIFINGWNIQTQALLAKQSIGFLPDNLPLYHELTVKEYLILIAKLKKIPKENWPGALERVLEALSLENHQNHLIGLLSKGLKQRVGIAQALLHNPSVLLLDEPTQGLDAKQMDDFQTIIQQYKSQGAIVLATHSEDEVKSLCETTLQFSTEGINAYDCHPCTA